jgi:hypothetical protein
MARLAINPAGGSSRPLRNSINLQARDHPAAPVLAGIPQAPPSRKIHALDTTHSSGFGTLRALVAMTCPPAGRNAQPGASGDT